VKRGESHLCVWICGRRLDLRGKRRELLGGICGCIWIGSDGARGRCRCARRPCRGVAEEDVCNFAVIVFFLFLFFHLFAVIVVAAILTVDSCSCRRLRRCCSVLVSGDVSILSLLASIAKHEHIVHNLNGSV
jgi:hypothetical protein